MTDRLRILTLAGAVALIGIVIAVVAVFGLEPYPDLPSLAAQPDPPVTGRVAYVEYGMGGACLHVVDGAGRDEELGCGPGYDGEIHWVDDGQLGVRTYRDLDASTVDVLDVATGELVDELELAAGPVPGLDRTNEAGDRVSTDVRTGLATVYVTSAGGDRQAVLEVDGPAGYTFVDVGWTDDGRWIAALDTIGRVVAIDAEGEAEARIWADDIGYFVVQ